MKAPTVTIMLPCYNARQTLPRALASLLAQTFDDWECVFVDDGSTDNPLDIVEAFDDDRIRYFRFEENRGRPIARQFALERARGEFLSFLDADDWMYPDKLQRQVRTMRDRPELTVTSTPLALVSPDGQLVGISGQIGEKAGSGAEGETHEMQELGRPPFPYVSAMVRLAHVRNVRYRPELLRSQDLAYFIEATRGRQYTVLGEPLYAYTNWYELDTDAHLRMLMHERKIYWSYRNQEPVRSSWLVCKVLGKAAVYRVARRFNFNDRILQRRFRQPTAVERERYEQARRHAESCITGGSATAGTLR